MKKNGQHLPGQHYFHIIFKITGSLQRFCKDWFVIVTSETGKHPENKEKTNQNIKKKGR
jgi:hypothetical protein